MNSNEHYKVSENVNDENKERVIIESNKEESWKEDEEKELDKDLIEKA